MPGRVPNSDLFVSRMNDQSPVPEDLLKAAGMRMPFGRFKGTRLIDLPEPYVVWFRSEGFPPGQLGARLALMYEIKLNGLEKLVRPLLDGEQNTTTDTLDPREAED